MPPPRKTNIPDWIATPPPENSYRAIFKWGAPDRFKPPGERLYCYISNALDMAGMEVPETRETGMTPVDNLQPASLTDSQIQALETIVGADNVDVTDFSRLKYSSGKTTEESIRLRTRGGAGHPVADAIVHPRSKEDIQSLVALCHDARIPITVYGGGSSVCFGVNCPCGGLVLVMQTHMHRALGLNETNRTITVEPGMLGPDYERILNRAPEVFGADNRYTGGHFPQSFEHSSVGGWIVTLGSGQLSSYYGDAADLVIGLDIVTPAGEIRTLPYPGTATGPRLLDMMTGSEGAFGVVASVTMKIFDHAPEHRKRFSFLFPSWTAAVNAAREISQGEFGMPALLRISDPEETEIALHHFGIAGAFSDRILQWRGMAPGQRCLCIGHTAGEKRFSAHVHRMVRRIGKQHGALYTTGIPVRRWEHGRFSDPYMREDLNDVGILIDTLETGVTWEQLPAVYQGVREFIKARPHTICMVHASHFYPQGTNLYFIFIGRFTSLEAFREFHAGIVERILQGGGSLSHHHGVGKLLAPWLTGHLGTAQMDALRALKNHFDPNGIMNPGGTLGLDNNRTRSGRR